MNREILFRAKPKDWKTNPEHNRWVEGFYLKRNETTYCFKEDYERNPVEVLHFIAEEQMTDWGLPNEFRLHEIDPDTLCQFVGWKDSHGTRIFENDVVEIVSHAGNSDKYLVWWCKEMSSLDAVPLDGIMFNGNDYWNEKYPKYHYDTFTLMLQDPWGDFSDIKVVGNIVDNPELCVQKEDEPKQERREPAEGSSLDTTNDLDFVW